MRLLLVLTSFLSLIACGTKRTPIAFEKIHPELDKSGQMRSLLEGLVDPPQNLLEAVIAQGVSRELATTAFAKFEEFRAQVRNDGVITMIDFTLPSNRNRYYMVDRLTGRVDAMTTAHGIKSDPNKDGIAEYFSNIPESRMSSLGAYLIQERYVGKHGPSLKLDGLESTNDRARARTIVLHPANYVRDEGRTQGWSWGCPAVPQSWISSVITAARDGSFMYAMGNNTYKESTSDIFMKTLTLTPEFAPVNEADEAPADGYLAD